MDEQKIAPYLLVVEDDPDDRLLFEIELEQSEWRGSVLYLNDGSELIDFICQLGQNADLPPPVPPSLIFINAFPRLSTLSELVQATRSIQKCVGDIPTSIMLDSALEYEYLKLNNLSFTHIIIKPITANQINYLLDLINK